MTTPIETFEDILAAMENNPRLQAAMRQHILDQEFLQLPTIVRELQQAVAQLSQLVGDYITATDTPGWAGSKPMLRRSKISKPPCPARSPPCPAISPTYQVATTEPGRRAVAKDDQSEPRHDERDVIHASRWEAQTFERNVLLPAIAGRRISREEANRLESADCVIQCEDQEGNIVHALAEISMTVQDTDRHRADERAKILAKATGTRAVPYVVARSRRREAKARPTWLSWNTPIRGRGERNGRAYCAGDSSRRTGPTQLVTSGYW